MSDEETNNLSPVPDESSEEQIAKLQELTLEQMRSVRDILNESQMIKATPCEITRARNKFLSLKNYYVKFECLQYYGSCMARGAAYAIIQHYKKHSNKPIISASLGNFAIALCHYASQYKIPITIVLPNITPVSKIIKCEQVLHGCNDNEYSEVKINGDNLEESVKFAMDTALKEHMIYIGEDHPDVIIGLTSVGLEIVTNVKNVDAIMVPIASGAMIAGIALAVKKTNKSIKIIGVESDMCEGFRNSRNAGKPVVVSMNYYSSLISELAITKIGTNAFSIANSLVDELITVKEPWIAAAMLQVLENEGYIVEGLGTMSLAATLYSGYLQGFKPKGNVVMLLSDGNLDPTIMGKCVQIGLFEQGRLVEILVEMSDQPNYFTNLISKIEKLSVNVYKAIYCTSIAKIICGTKNAEHLALVKQFLNNNKYKWHGFYVPQNLY